MPRIQNNEHIKEHPGYLKKKTKSNDSDTTVNLFAIRENYQNDCDATVPCQSFFTTASLQELSDYFENPYLETEFSKRRSIPYHCDENRLCNKGIPRVSAKDLVVNENEGIYKRTQPRRKETTNIFKTGTHRKQPLEKVNIFSTLRSKCMKIPVSGKQLSPAPCEVSCKRFKTVFDNIFESKDESEDDVNISNEQSNCKGVRNTLQTQPEFNVKNGPKKCCDDFLGTVDSVSAQFLENKVKCGDASKDSTQNRKRLSTDSFRVKQAKTNEIDDQPDATTDYDLLLDVSDLGAADVSPEIKHALQDLKTGTLFPG